MWLVWFICFFVGGWCVFVLVGGWCVLFGLFVGGWCYLFGSASRNPILGTQRYSPTRFNVYAMYLSTRGKCKGQRQRQRQPWLSKHVLESHDGTYWTRRRYSACRTGDRKQAKANRQTSHRGTNYRIILQLWLSKTVLESHDGTYWTRRRYSASRKGDRKETKSYTIHSRWLFERVQPVTTLICRFEFQTPFC